MAFPRLAGPDRMRVFRRAAAATAAFGVLVAVACAALAEPLVRNVSGEEYLRAAVYAPVFALLGTMLALVNLGLMSSIAVASVAFTRLLWLGAAGEAALVSIWLHDSVGQIVLACSLVAGSLIVAGWVTVLRQPAPLGSSTVPVPG